MNTKKSFSNILKLIILIAICVAASIIVVWPLWKFSTGTPKLYTYIVLSLLGLFLLYLLIKSIIRTPVKKIIRILINLLLIAAGFSGLIILILNRMRLFGLFCLLGALILVFVFNFLYTKFAYDKK